MRDSHGLKLRSELMFTISSHLSVRLEPGRHLHKEVGIYERVLKGGISRRSLPRCHENRSFCMRPCGRRRSSRGEFILCARAHPRQFVAQKPTIASILRREREET